MARKSLWKPEFVEQAKNLCLLGATDTEIAAFFDVSPTTFGNWKRKTPELRAALKAGKMSADAKVAKSLYQRAVGFSQQEVDIRVIGGQLVQTVFTKKYAPDTTAQIFWLKNRQPEMWKERRERDMTVDDQLKLVQLERERYELAKLIASDTDTETEDDQRDFLLELSKRLPN
jgi:hypothetical protein